MPVPTIFLSLILIFVAIILVVIGTLFLAFPDGEGESKRRVEAGGLLIIGPLPIVFGSSEKAAKILLFLGIVLTALTILVYLLVTRVI